MAAGSPKETETAMPPQVAASGPVRYIKLGAGGDLEAECLANGAAVGTIYFGFGMERPERLAACRARRWQQLRELVLTAEYAGKPRVATNVANQARALFEDHGATVWITFHAGRLWWCRSSHRPERRAGRDGVWRLVDGGWSDHDAAGTPLETWHLSGRVTKLMAFRGTSCALPPDDAEYVRRRINGRTIPEVEAARAARDELLDRVGRLLRLLEPSDFETLVDLVFTNTGWRRLGPLGGTQKTIDLELQLPTTGEQAFVQVKAVATARLFAEYVAALQERSQDAWMFFAYHSGEVGPSVSRVQLLGPQALARMVLDAGIVSWLLRKTA